MEKMELNNRLMLMQKFFKFLHSFYIVSIFMNFLKTFCVFVYVVYNIYENVSTYTHHILSPKILTCLSVLITNHLTTSLLRVDFT